MIDFTVSTTEPIQLGTEQIRVVEAISPTAVVEEVDDGAKITLVDLHGTTEVTVHDGEKGDTGPQGEPGIGIQGPKGDTGATGPQGAPGQGVPTGGTAGQVLTKTSGTDYDTGWQTPSVPVQDVQVNGTSVVTDGVANVPYGTNNAYGVAKGNEMWGVGIQNGVIYVNEAATANIKNGTVSYKPIVPTHQHESTFYGLAKAAGDSTQSASSNAVGAYTDAAKVAIQKMLGIYEAPWELIREDTGTNATEADVDITVDGNGNPFELTDAYLMFWLPQQNNEAKKAGSGRFNFYYNNSDYCTAETGGYTQAANAESKGAQILIEQSKGAIKASAIQFYSVASRGTIVGIYNNITNRLNAISFFSDTKYFSKVNITAVTGTWNYRLYGKRKWN